MDINISTKEPLQHFKILKILCVIDSLGSGGAQRQLVELAIGFKESGNEVSFLVYHKDNFFKKILDSNNIVVYLINEANYVKRLFRMRKFIRKGKFDSVLSFLEASNFICEFAGIPYRKWKLVVGERSADPKITKSVKLGFYRWFHLFADHIVANSHENIKIVRKVNPFVHRKRCHVIYNIIDFDKWKPATLDYCFKKNEKLNIIVVASHQYLKNLNGLIEAISVLSEIEKSNIQVNWYGGLRADNSKAEALQKIAKYRLENIFHFYPPSSTISDYIYTSDALGLFSFHEGLPNVVCEAMACGKVVFASGVSDIPSIINDDRLIFDPKSTMSIVRSLRFLMDAPFAEFEIISKKNLENARILFNKNKIICKYLILLSK